MSGFVSVGYTPQTTDICVCCRHVKNVGLTRRQHSVMSAFVFADKVMLGENVADTVSYKDVGISTRNCKGIVGKFKNNTTMVELAAGLVAWLLGYQPPYPGSLCKRGWLRAVWKG
jgi:hypothetical protein